MEFLIADTFTDSLTKLTGAEQTATKTTAFDLQVNPANPGLQFHRIEKSKDANFWSVRVSGDLRVIVHRTSGSLLLCYVGHHDDAYKWAERRKLERHPNTGAAQLVEVRERVQEITVPKYVEAVAAKPGLFASMPDQRLLGYGVPPEWLDEVKKANEDTLLALADHLPNEAAEALLELATGATPQAAAAVPEGIDPLHHPDAQRRFRFMSSTEELRQALEAPWEKWIVFLHPAQRKIVERDYSGPARISGSAGTGKTIVALHRAVYLARKFSNSRLLLTTFSEPLANALRNKLRLLISREPRIGERLEILSLSALGKRLYEINIGKPKIAGGDMIRKSLEAARAASESKLSIRFLETEWEQIVDAWQLERWEDYRDVPRLGRRTRLKDSQRQALWLIFERVRKDLKQRGLITQSELFNRLAEHFSHSTRPYNFVVVDECQDIGIAELRFLAAIGAGEPNGLFFAGDLGQRIFQQPFSWRACGVDIRGRSTTLRINYRTSHQIRTQADKLLGPSVSDVDGNSEDRKGTVSLFNGPKPAIRLFGGAQEERDAVAEWLKDQAKDGVAPHEIALFVRSNEQVGRAIAAAEASGVPFKVLDRGLELISGKLSIATMHLAKGLEFRSVAAIACDDEIIPLQQRIETVTDDSDLEDVYNTERQLLYVACTRARDRLMVTGVEPASEFLTDLAE
jgi:UvrD-like helicase C-terminal domain/AAA domain